MDISIDREQNAYSYGREVRLLRRRYDNVWLDDGRVCTYRRSPGVGMEPAAPGPCVRCARDEVKAVAPARLTAGPRRLTGTRRPTLPRCVIADEAPLHREDLRYHLRFDTSAARQLEASARPQPGPTTYRTTVVTIS